MACEQLFADCIRCTCAPEWSDASAGAVLDRLNAEKQKQRTGVHAALQHVMRTSTSISRFCESLEVPKWALGMADFPF